MGKEAANKGTIRLSASFWPCVYDWRRLVLPSCSSIPPGPRQWWLALHMLPSDRDWTRHVGPHSYTTPSCICEHTEGVCGLSRQPPCQIIPMRLFFLYFLPPESCWTLRPCSKSTSGARGTLSWLPKDVTDHFIPCATSIFHIFCIRLRTFDMSHSVLSALHTLTFKTIYI